ncbi:ABC transporter permease [Flavobacterium sp. NKUCC04_CG]|uniref:ABC transporter permease n=1 Tax=Flavobacterium sp. NKUCC04_CG TaxID=2842121 RepID=UPI001C5B6C0F|nr:ABC transporter permease [Flavobacterium sp. NKUCC04_CG]MBW3519409.1 ABC transporter permease [Flavobacterium sp. NKUCC04_CG]
MSILSLIIKREFIAKVRNKSFIVMTFLSPVIFVLLAFLITYLSTMKADVKKIAIHDETGYFVKHFKNTDLYEYQDLSAIDIKIIKDSIITEAYEGLLYIPKAADISTLQNGIQYISNDSPSFGFISNIEGIIADEITTYNVIKSGMDVALIEATRAKVDLTLEKASGETTVKGLNEIKIAIGGLFGYMIMMFIIIYGNLVMRSVIEEKTNRIIEIIISSVKPFQLMMGKIIGTSLAGILQFSIWAIVGGILLVAVSAIFGINASTNVANVPLDGVVSENAILNAQNYLTEIMELPILSLVGYFFLFFLGGYFLYSSLYAAIGAAVDSETDTQQFLLPIMLPLMLGVYVGFFTVIHNPHGTVATVFSMIPFTSPIVMLMRIPFGVPWWQILLSLLILFGTFIVTVWLAAKIYRIGILMYGKRPSWKELYKWLKY